MRMTKQQLLDAARKAAKYLPESSADLMNELANRLDVTSVALSEALAQCTSAAAEAAYLRGEIEQHSRCTHQCDKCGEADPCINDDVCWALKHPIPATQVIIDSIKAEAVKSYSDKPGFTFEYGSIHAHFGNGDVMVGDVSGQNGSAGICFAPVKEKLGGVGTEYKWTEGKNTEDVGSVFVIMSTNAAGLLVIRDKLDIAIASFSEATSNGR